MDRRQFFRSGFIGLITGLLLKPLNVFSSTKTLKTGLDAIDLKDDEMAVGVYIKYKDKEYNGYVLVPPEKQNMKHISTQTSGMAESQDRTIKRLLGKESR